MLPRCSLRAECRGRRVEITALSPNGSRALRVLEGRLAEGGGAATRDADSLVVTYPPLPAEASSEAERLAAPSPFDALRALATSWTLLSEPISPTLLVAGVFSYDMLGCLESLPDEQQDPLGFPEFVFWLPESLLVIDHRRRRTTAVQLVHGGEGADADQGRAAGEIARLAEFFEAPVPAPAAPQTRAPAAITCDTDDDAFAALVRELKERIVAGDVFQIVPSRTFSAPCPAPLETYARLRTLNPSPYMFFVRGPEHTVFGASPETCVKVSGSPRTVEIRPIAGTARRGKTTAGEPDADLDGRLEAELRLDEKELAEHMMLIDLARNDVARVCKPGTRHVPRLLTVDRYSHVMHLVSHVEGQLADGLDALHAYAAAMNMGTLVGAPKLKAAEILRQREATRRGPYGGAVGYLTAGGDMDTAIIIRSATVKAGVATVRAGAGVVYDSDPASEARETRSKAQAVLDALGGERPTR